MDATAGYALAAGAALVAGAANAIAGGGSLLSFPALVAAGLPSVIANLTNTVALCPGYLGAAFAQRTELAGQRARIVAVLPISAVGGAIGAELLLHTAESAFAAIVPFLLLFAGGLLALQTRIRGWLDRRRGAVNASEPRERAWTASLPVGLAAIYGGYFGAGLGLIVLSALAIIFRDSLTRLNALRQLVTLTANITAAIVFVASGEVAWTFALIMAVAALVGGVIGGRIATKISPAALRVIVVTCALAFAAYYFVAWLR